MIVNWPLHIRQNHDTASCHRCLNGMPCTAYDLFTCVRCGCSEGEVPTDCPGYRLDGVFREAIYAGCLDYDRKLGWNNPLTGERLGKPPAQQV